MSPKTPHTRPTSSGGVPPSLPPGVLLRRSLRWAGPALGLLLLLLVAPLPPALVTIPTYLPLHTAMEVFAIAVAALVFAIGWNSDRAQRDARLLVAAACFLVVALLDFGHTLSYVGMPVFVTPASGQKALVFWLAARMVAALGLALLVLLPSRIGISASARMALFWGGPVLVALFYVAVLGHEAWFPVFFVPGTGLTPLKIALEYVVIAIHLATAAALLARPGRTGLSGVSLLLAALWLSVLSELCFTLYTNLADTLNILGHVYKVLAYYLLYRFLFVGGTREPFERLRESERRYADLVDNAPDAIVALDAQGRIVSVNPAKERMTGYSAAELIGRHFAAAEHVANECAARAIGEFRRILSGEPRPPIEMELIHREGYSVHVEAKSQLIAHERGAAVQVTLRDITERKLAEKRLHYLANFDPLTDLPNRTRLDELLAGAVQDAERDGRLVAVMFVDLDRFKVINDTLGHDFGDEVLKLVALELKGSVRPGDVVSRYGGDEFVVVLARVAQAEDVVAVAHKFLQHLSRPFVVGGRELFVTPSIGIALWPLDDPQPGNLLRNADAAMYLAKERGRNNFQFYTADLNQRVARRLQIETALRRSLLAGEFELHYQPQVEVRGGRIFGAEALLRWQHPTLGRVPPDEFIPIAEDSGIIVALGEWVLRSACAQARAWHRAGHSGLRVSVNVSGRQLEQEGFIETVRAALAEAGLAPESLELELTESVLMQRLDIMADRLRALAALGVSISMDDFGTGYSSLSYLKRLPIDVLKIDRSFVRDIPGDTDDAAIASAILALAHSMGQRVIAEGVETRAQFLFLQRHGCDAIQGYLFSRPLPAAGLEALLGQGRTLQQALAEAAPGDG